MRVFSKKKILGEKSIRFIHSFFFEIFFFYCYLNFDAAFWFFEKKNEWGKWRFLQAYIIRKLLVLLPNRSLVENETKLNFSLSKRRKAILSRNQRHLYFWKRSRNLPPRRLNHLSPSLNAPLRDARGCPGDIGARARGDLFKWPRKRTRTTWAPRLDSKIFDSIKRPKIPHKTQKVSSLFLFIIFFCFINRSTDGRFYFFKIIIDRNLHFAKAMRTFSKNHSPCWSRQQNQNFNHKINFFFWVIYKEHACPVHPSVGKERGPYRVKNKPVVGKLIYRKGKKIEKSMINFEKMRIKEKKNCCEPAQRLMELFQKSRALIT